MKNQFPEADCLKCAHFYVTWDNAFPRGCKLFKFKGKAIPSLTVYEATGAPCEHFKKKQITEKAN
ncbi:MAG: uracil-DNA glycosylase [Fibrobacteres bacterium]|nr:uracil-DNA glycosylase [Fibrobacterota bacterium]